MAKSKASSPLGKGYPAQYGRYQLIDVQLIDVVAGEVVLTYVDGKPVSKAVVRSVA